MLAFQIVCRKIRWAQNVMGVYKYDVLAISEDTRHRYHTELAKIVELNGFYDKCNTLPISEEKAIISIFRIAMNMDSFVEEFVNLQEKKCNSNSARYQK